MIKISVSHHRGTVALSLTRKVGRLFGRYETVEIFLTPEFARMVGISLIEDAAAADCYRREMADAATLDKERLGE